MAANASDAVLSADAPAPYKNQLQQFCQRTGKVLPIYTTEYEGGEAHAPRFKSTVQVCGQLFSSTRSFSRRKDAERDAARVACEAVLVTRDTSGDLEEALEMIDQDVLVHSKSILKEFADKMDITRPIYFTIAVKEKPMCMFEASVVFDGSTYTGEAETYKKGAEQKAARAAIKSILASGNTCMVEIVRSKKKLKKAAYTGVVSQDQEVHNIQRNAIPTFTPIVFMHPVAYTTGYGVAAVGPSVNSSSAEIVTNSGPNKRKADDN